MDEAELERQYQDYKRQFEQWRDANKSHPDKDAFKQYEQQWKAWEAQVDQRRAQIRAQKLASGASVSTSAAAATVAVAPAAAARITGIPTAISSYPPPTSQPPPAASMSVPPPATVPQYPAVPSNVPVTMPPGQMPGFPAMPSMALPGATRGGTDMMQQMMMSTMNPMFLSMMSTPGMMEQFAAMLGMAAPEQKREKEKKKKKKKSKAKEAVTEDELLKVFSDFISGSSKGKSNDIAGMISKFIDDDKKKDSSSSSDEDSTGKKPGGQGQTPLVNTVPNPAMSAMMATMMGQMGAPGGPMMGGLPTPMGMAAPPPAAAPVVPPPAYTGPGCPPPGPRGSYTLEAPPPLESKALFSSDMEPEIVAEFSTDIGRKSYFDYDDPAMRAGAARSRSRSPHGHERYGSRFEQNGDYLGESEWAGKNMFEGFGPMPPPGRGMRPPPGHAFGPPLGPPPRMGRPPFGPPGGPFPTSRGRFLPTRGRSGYPA